VPDDRQHGRPATGGQSLVGLAPQTKIQAPPNYNMKHYKLVEFLSKLNVKPPWPKRKVPPHKRKALLLTTFWQRFCLIVRYNNKISSIRPYPEIVQQVTTILPCWRYQVGAALQRGFRGSLLCSTVYLTLAVIEKVISTR